jgi:integrase/recombinase XerD
MGTALETYTTAGEIDTTAGPSGWLALVGAWMISHRSPHTRAAYRHDLEVWHGWTVAHHLHPLTAPRAAVDMWLNELAADGVPASTRARRFTAIRSFYRYALAEGAIDRDPTAQVRAPKVPTAAIRTGLTLAEARAIVEVASIGPTHHRATVALLLGAALRVSEAITATVGHITNVDGHTVLTVVGKGDRRRDVPLSPLALELLAAPEPSATGHIIHRDGEPLDRYQVAHVVRSLGRAAEIGRPISPHILRHTAATLALDGGAPIQNVADLLGHSSPTTTMRYVAGRERLRDNAAYVVATALSTGVG